MAKQSGAPNMAYAPEHDPSYGRIPSGGAGFSQPASIPQSGRNMQGATSRFPDSGYDRYQPNEPLYNSNPNTGVSDGSGNPDLAPVRPENPMYPPVSPPNAEIPSNPINVDVPTSPPNVDVPTAPTAPTAPYDPATLPASDYVATEQMDYNTGQPQYEAFTPPDPADQTMSAQETADSYGGGQSAIDPTSGGYQGTAGQRVNDTAMYNNPLAVAQNAGGGGGFGGGFGGGGNAESYLGENRQLNDISSGADSRAAAETAIYDSMASRLDPRFAQKDTDLEISLRNRGLSEGDAAFDAAMDTQGREKTDAYNQAMWQSVQGGGVEGQRDFEMDSSRRGQMMDEALGLAGQDLEGQRNSIASQANAVNAQGNANQYALGMGNLSQSGIDSQRQFDMQNQQNQNQYDLGIGGLNQSDINSQRNFAMQNQQNQNQYSLGMGNLNQSQQQNDRNYDLSSQQQGYNQQYQNAEYQNQMRQQQISEEMLRRNQPLNEMNALLTGSQVSQPNFNGYNTAGNAGGVDYSGAANSQYNAALDGTNANNAMWQGLMGGAAGMASGGMFG